MTEKEIPWCRVEICVFKPTGHSYKFALQCKDRWLAVLRCMETLSDIEKECLNCVDVKFAGPPRELERVRTLT